MRFTRMLVAFAVAVPLVAQQPDSAKKPAMPMGREGMTGMMGPPMGGGGGHMEQMMGPMTRVMAFSPAHLLMHREVVNLTDPQVAKLTALRDAAKPAHDAAMADLQTHRRAMMTLMTGASPDTVQLKLHFQAMQAAMAKAHWAMLSAAAQARGLLTDTQRARADGWADAMEHMMPMMERGRPGMPGMMRQRHDPEHH